MVLALSYDSCIEEFDYCLDIEGNAFSARLGTITVRETPVGKSYHIGLHLEAQFHEERDLARQINSCSVHVLNHSFSCLRINCVLSFYVIEFLPTVV